MKKSETLIIKEYAAILTGVLTAIFTFDCLWAMTKLNVEHVIAMSMFAAFGVAMLFLFLTCDEERKMEEELETSKFVDVDGLNVLIQRSRKGGRR